MLTVLQGWSLPPQMHTHTARAQLQVIQHHRVVLFFFKIALFFPLFLLISQVRPRFPCAANRKVSSTIPLCTAEPQGTRLPNLPPLNCLQFTLLLMLMVIKFWHFYWLFQMRTQQQYKKAVSAIQLSNITNRVKYRHKPRHQSFPSLMGVGGWFVFLKFSTWKILSLSLFLVKWCLRLFLLLF